MKRLLLLTVLIFAISTASLAQKKSQNAMILLETSLGNIKIELFNDTPVHRDNFMKLVNEGFYDGILFHRVIQGFMIQTGDPESKTAEAGARLGSGGPGYTLPAEIVPSRQEPAIREIPSAEVRVRSFISLTAQKLPLQP